MSRKLNKRRGLGLRPRTVAIILTVLTFGSLAGLGFLWQKKQIHSLGRDIRLRETRLEELKRANANLLRAYAAMCSPVELDARVKRMNLGLAAPLPDQIIRMPEPVFSRKSQQARIVAEKKIDQTNQ
jgi:hypothetical protein